MKINNEIEVDPFILIECPYCYNIRELNVPMFYVNLGKIMVSCDICRNPIILEMVIPNNCVDRLGMDSENLRINNPENE